MQDVGCDVGLRPRRSDSGESQPQLRIIKEATPTAIRQRLTDTNIRVIAFFVVMRLATLSAAFQERRFRKSDLQDSSHVLIRAA